MSHRRNNARLVIAGAATLLAAAPAYPAAEFSFRAIEFAPRDERLPVARAFVARVAARGTPIAEAVAAINRAGARCRPDRDGTIVCRASRMVTHSEQGTGELDDVTWTVRLVPAADDTIADATVSRTASDG